MTSLRATNWLNSLDAGTPDSDGWLAVCPRADVSEAEVRAELARLGYATEDRSGQVCVRVPQRMPAQRSAALARYQSKAADVIRRNVPAPWDVLRDVATAEFREWADAYLALAAAELARLEEAVAAAQTPQALDAIVADWPEVTP